jgi:predicted permease
VTGHRVSALREGLRRVLGFLGLGRADSELDEEMRFHVAMLEQENRRRGLPEVEAARRARLAFGGLEQAKEACRDQRGLPWADALRQDLRQAARSLAKAPAFTVACVLTLTLGIGAVTVVLTLLKRVLLDPLPYPDARRLVRVFESGPGARFENFPMSPLSFLDYRREARSVSGLAVYTREDVQLSGDGEPVRLSAMQVCDGYFRVLGLQPLLGRTFRGTELRSDARVVLLGHRLWRDRFSSDPGILGRALRLNGEPWTVVGVMPAELEHVGGDYRSYPQGDTVDAWTPVPLEDAEKRKYWHYLNGIARLAPGATPEQAVAELRALKAGFVDHNPAIAKWTPEVAPLAETVIGRDRTAVLILVGAAALVMAIACANVAGLLLARALARRRELAVRFALGASRPRLARHLLAEAGLLAVLGALSGVALARLGLPAVLAALPPDFPRVHAVHLDLTILAATLTASVATVLLFGVAPALHGTRGELQESLAEGRGTTAGAGALRLRSLVVVAELTLACALLVGAGLLVRSFRNVLASDPGFGGASVVTASLGLPPRFASQESKARFWSELEQRLAEVPGVAAVGAGTGLPWTGYDENTGLEVVGDVPKRDEKPNARFASISPGFFPALGIPLRAGRLPDAGDVAGRPRVVLVNEAFARIWLPAGAVGRTLHVWGQDREVVGVVGDVKDTPDAPFAAPAVYFPLAQEAPFATASLVVRAGRGPSVSLLPQVRATLGGLDRELPLADVRGLEAITATALARRRFLLTCVTGIAALALALAAVGAYGALAYGVAQRRRELGVRMALGAGRARILGLVVGQGARLAAAGIVLGAAAALLLGGLISAQLYGVSPRDPWSFVAGAAGVAIIALASSLLPAWRATRADPLAVLRAD